MEIDENQLHVYSVAEMESAGTVRLYGRTVPQHQPYYLFWTSSGLEWEICAREMWLDLDVAYESAEPWVTVEIDGALFSRQPLMPGRQSLCLYRNMTDGNPHRVRFALDTQAAEGTFVAVSQLRTDGAPLPMTPPPMRIECIGDSITSGEGLALPASYTGWATGMHSASRAYHRILMQQRDADVRVLSRGGYGVYCGWNNDIRSAMPRYYDAVCGFQDNAAGRALGACAENDFAAWQPDVIFVLLGANDRGAAGRDPWIDANGTAHQLKWESDGILTLESEKLVQNAVTSFLQNLRAKNPAARIVWACGVLDAVIAPTIRAALDRYAASAGDGRVEFRMLSPVSDRSAHNHPGVETHRRMAAELGAILDETAQNADF